MTSKQIVLVGLVVVLATLVLVLSGLIVFQYQTSESMARELLQPLSLIILGATVVLSLITGMFLAKRSE